MKRLMSLIIFITVLMSVGTGYAKAPPPVRTISFTFDDGFTSAYTKAYPIFKKHGYKASVAIYDGSLVSPQMGQSKLKTLQRNGWEIISHSMTHPRLNNVSGSAQRKEIVDSYHKFNGKGFKVNGFVTPYSECSQACANTTKQNYKYAFTKYLDSKAVKPKSALITRKNTDKYRMHRVALDNLSLKEAKDYVDQLAKYSGWIPFYLHDVGSKSSMSTKDLDALLAYIKSKGITIDSPKVAVDRIYGK